ncbi:MAG: pilus assembly protein CpaF [Pontimonas sp.]|jgi:pilus assembly protein CpaF
MTSSHPTASIVAQRIRARFAHEAGELDAITAEEVHDSLGATISVEEGFSREIHNELQGLGVLQPFLDDPSIEELWINGPGSVFVATAGVSRKIDAALSDTETRRLIERMLRHTGRRVDTSQPFVDASLPDGSRLHVVIPDITKAHWSINIRKFSAGLRELADLVEAKALSLQAAHFLRGLVREGKSVLVSGATQAGKTTLLAALLAAVPDSERVISVEETFELQLPRSDHVGMQCRGPNLEGTGEVTLRRLVKEALRMRPDRIVVGEVREAEALDLLIALNSGLPGMCSLHAKSARHALIKISTLPLLAGRNIDHSFVLPTVAGTIDAVVHVERGSDGTRRVMEIIHPTGEVTGGLIEAVTSFDRRGGVLARVEGS